MQLKNIWDTHPKTPDLLYWYHRPVQEHIKQGEKYLQQKFYHVALRCFEAALIMESNNRTELKYREKCISEE